MSIKKIDTIDIDYSDSLAAYIQPSCRIETHYELFDEMMPLLTGNVYVVGARRGMHVHDLFLSIMFNIDEASENDEKSLYVSNTFSGEEAAMKYVGFVGNVPRDKINRRNFNMDEADAFNRTIIGNDFSNVGFLCYPGVNFEDLYDTLCGSRPRRERTVVFIDDARLFAEKSGMKVRQLIHQLKHLALEAEVVIMLYYEINSKMLDRRKDHWPSFKMGDFNECREADGILAVIHPSFYGKRACIEQYGLEVEKNPVGGEEEVCFYLTWDEVTHRITNGSFLYKYEFVDEHKVFEEPLPF